MVRPPEPEPPTLPQAPHDEPPDAGREAAEATRARKPPADEKRIERYPER